MRAAVLSDIHGNLEALRAVLARAKELGAAGEVLCLGDVVGYNANPNECIEIVRSEGFRCIAGNHDTRAAGLEGSEEFSPLARKAVLWTKDRLSDGNRRYLAELPRETGNGDWFLCHGSIHDTDRYILSIADLRDNFGLLAGLPGGPRICFYGHTHVPSAFSALGRTLAPEREDRIEIREDRLYLINPGAVGQPRDGDPRAAFLIYDDAERTVTFHRAAYDIAACREKIIRAGLPPRLAERLELGQ